MTVPAGYHTDPGIGCHMGSAMLASCHTREPGMQEGNQTLAGVSRAVVLRVCAQQAQQLQAFKLARWAYTQLQALRLPPSWQVCNAQNMGSKRLESELIVGVLLEACVAPLGIANPNMPVHQGDACIMHNTKPHYQSMLCRTQWT